MDQEVKSVICENDKYLRHCSHWQATVTRETPGRQDVGHRNVYCADLVPHMRRLQKV